MARLPSVTSKDQVAAKDHAVFDSIVAIRENHSRGIPSEDAQIVEFTRQLLRKHRADEATFKAVQGRFGNDELIQLTTAIGYYALLCMTVNACELEAGSGAEVLQ